MSASILGESFKPNSGTLDSLKRVATTLKPGRKAAITGAALLGLAAVTLAFYFVGHSRGMNFASSMRMGGMKLADWTKSLNFSKGQIVAAATGTLGGLALIGAGVKYGPRTARATKTKVSTLSKAAKEKVNTLRAERAVLRAERAERAILRAISQSFAKGTEKTLKYLQANQLKEQKNETLREQLAQDAERHTFAQTDLSSNPCPMDI